MKTKMTMWNEAQAQAKQDPTLSQAEHFAKAKAIYAEMLASATTEGTEVEGVTPQQLLTIDEVAAEAIKKGDAKGVWKNERVYINGYGRDVTAYMYLMNSGTEGQKLVLNVYINCPGQSGKWIENRKRQVFDQICGKYEDVLDMSYCTGK